MRTYDMQKPTKFFLPSYQIPPSAPRPRHVPFAESSRLQADDVHPSHADTSFFERVYHLRESQKGQCCHAKSVAERQVSDQGTSVFSPDIGIVGFPQSPWNLPRQQEACETTLWPQLG